MGGDQGTEWKFPFNLSLFSFDGFPQAPSEDHPCNLTRTTMRISFPALKSELLVNILGELTVNIAVLLCLSCKRKIPFQLINRNKPDTSIDMNSCALRIMYIMIIYSYSHSDTGEWNTDCDCVVSPLKYVITTSLTWLAVSQVPA